MPQSPLSVASASTAPSSPHSGSVLLPFSVEEDEAFMAEQRREAGEMVASGQRGEYEEEEEDRRTCRYDGDHFNSVGEFIDHLKYVHSMTLSQYNKAKEAAQAAKKPRQAQQKRLEQRKKNEHHCELCGKSFTSLSRLADHYLSHEAAFQQEDKVKAKVKKGTLTAAQPTSPVIAPSKPRLHLVSRLPLPPPPSETGDEEDTVCAVCLSGESTDENLIMFCDGPCRLAYHQECIGADYVPEGNWYCSERCERGEEMADMGRWVKDRREEYERRQRERIAAQQSGGSRETDPAQLMLKGFWEEVDGYFSMRGMVEARELLEEAMLDEALMAPVERGRSYREQWADDDAREEEEMRGAFSGSNRRRKSAAEAAAQKAKSYEEEESQSDEEDEVEEVVVVEEIEQDESAMTKEEIVEKRRKQKLKKALSYEHSSERVKRVKKRGRKEPAIRLSIYAQLATRPANAIHSTSSSASSTSPLQIEMLVDSPVSSPISPPHQSPPSEPSSSPLQIIEEEQPSRTLSSPVITTISIEGATEASSSTASVQPLAARSKSDGAALSLSSAAVRSTPDLQPAPLSSSSTNAPTTSPSQGGKQPRSGASLSSTHPTSNKTPRGNTTGGKAPRTSLSTSTDAAALNVDEAVTESVESSSSSSTLHPPSSSPRGKMPSTPLGKHPHPMASSQQSTKAPHTSAPSLLTSNEDELKEPIAPKPALFFSLRALDGDYMRSVGFRVSAVRVSEARESGAGYVFPPFVYDPHTQTMEGDYDEKEEENSEAAVASKEEKRARRKRDRADHSELELDLLSLAQHEPAASRGVTVAVPSELQRLSAPSSPRTPHSLTQRPSHPRAGSVPSVSSHYLSSMVTRTSAPVVPLSPLNAAGSPLAVPLGPNVSSSGRPIRLTTRALSSSAFRTVTASPASATATLPAPLIELLPAADTDEVANELWLCQQSYLAQHGHNEHVKTQLLQAVQLNIQHFLAVNGLPATFTSPTSQPALLRVLWERRRTEREVLDHFAENSLTPKAWREYMVQVEEAEARGDEAADEVDEVEEERRREHRKLRRADRIVQKVVGELVAAVGKRVKQGRDDLRLLHRRQKAERRARKSEEQIARRVAGCMDWMLSKIVAKEQLRERRERIRRMGEEERRKEMEKEAERRKERRRRRKLKRREKRRAEREKKRQRMAKLLRKKEKEKRRRRREKERVRRQAREEEEDRQRRRRRDKKRRRRKAEASTSESSISSSDDDSSGESTSASERSVSSASDSELSEEEKASSSSSPSSDDDKVEGQEVYCYCRQPSSEHVPMIGCDVCGEWYHGKCVSLTAAEMDNIDSYVCAKCEKHDDRRTTLFHQQREDSQVDEQQSHVPAIRLKRVDVMDVAQTTETGGRADSEVGGETGEETAEKKVRTLYEVVSNEGAVLAELAEDELLSQPLSIHRAASLKLRLRKVPADGRASRRQHLWRVTRVVSKNVYWARESGHNWHYIRETNISSTDKRWMEAPGVEMMYAEDGKWLIQQHDEPQQQHSSGQQESDTEPSVASEVEMAAEDGAAAETPQAAGPQRSHKKSATPKRGHKRKQLTEPAEQSVQRHPLPDEAMADKQEEEEPNNPPVKFPESPSQPPPPPAPRIRRPPRPRMSEAQRLMTNYLDAPGAHSDDEDDEDHTEEQKVAEDEASVQDENHDSTEADDSGGRRRSSRRQSRGTSMKKGDAVDDIQQEAEAEAEETARVVQPERDRRSTRSQSTPPPSIIASASSNSSRATFAVRHPVAPLFDTPIRTSRRTANSLSAATEQHNTMAGLDDRDSRSSRVREKRKQQLDHSEPQPPHEQRGHSQQPTDSDALRTRNGLSSPISGKSAVPVTAVQSLYPSPAQRTKRQRRNLDLALIDSTPIFAQRSRRAAADTATRNHTTHSAAVVEQAVSEQEEDEPMSDTASVDADEDGSSEQSAALFDGRRRSTRSKPVSAPQLTAPTVQPRRAKSAVRNGRQVTLHSFFGR